jgi:proline racemase
VWNFQLPQVGKFGLPVDTVRHPENPDIHGVTFAEFAMPLAGPGTVSRNAVIVAPGHIDRSPSGTGTCARLALLHARGALGAGQGFVHESIIGSRFEAGIARATEVAGRPGYRAHRRRPGLITGVFKHSSSRS